MFDRVEAERLENQLRLLKQAENKLVGAKNDLVAAWGSRSEHNWMMVEVEKCSLRVHFEVKRITQKLAEEKR